MIIFHILSLRNKMVNNEIKDYFIGPANQPLADKWLTKIQKETDYKQIMNTV